MKRLGAILLGLMMLAGLCACGRRTSSRTCSQNAGACHGHHSGAAHPFGGGSRLHSRRHHTADGGGAGLVRAVLLQCGPRLGSQPVSDLRTMPGGGHRYLAAVLACGPEGSWNVTSQERNMIAAGGTRTA